MCLQAYERHVDQLSRALQRGEEAGADLGQERHSLLQQLRGAEKVALARQIVPTCFAILTIADVRPFCGP